MFLGLDDNANMGASVENFGRFEKFDTSDFVVTNTSLKVLMVQGCLLLKLWYTFYFS